MTELRQYSFARAGAVGGADEFKVIAYKSAAPNIRGTYGDASDFLIGLDITSYHLMRDYTTLCPAGNIISHLL